MFCLIQIDRTKRPCLSLDLYPRNRWEWKGHLAKGNWSSSCHLRIHQRQRQIWSRNPKISYCLRKSSILKLILIMLLIIFLIYKRWAERSSKTQSLTR
jgi:hypothetical protein